MKKQNNKGAAMVTVLIAITFIAILASSLLYASYINYKTKSVRFQSADNFYSDEFALDEITSTVQQAASKADTFDDRVKAIETAIGYSGPGGGKTGTYSGSTLAGYAQLTLADALKIRKITVSDGKCELKGDKYILYGVTVETESGNNQDAASGRLLTTTIQTDIYIDMSKSTKDGPKLNDFSIISDSPIYIDKTRGGNLILSGDLYVKQQDVNPADSDYGSPDKYALKIAGGRSVQLLGELVCIDGDLIIDNNSSLYIAGDAIIAGDVKMRDDSVLVCTGSVKMKGSITDESSSTTTTTVLSGKNSTIKGKDGIEQNMLGSGKWKDLPTDGLATAVFSENLVLGSGSGNAPSISLVTDVTNNNPGGKFPTAVSYFTQISGGQNYHEKANLKYDVTCYFGNEVKNYKDYYNVFMNGNCDVINGESQFVGNLIMMDHDVQIKQNVTNTTVLTTGTIHFSERSSTSMTKMADEGFAACKNVLFSKTTDTSPVKFAGATDLNSDGYLNLEDMKIAASKGNVYAFDAKTGTWGSSPVSLSSAEIDALDLDDASRYLVYYNGCNYTPYGYFLSPDTGSIIAEYFSLVIDNDSLKAPYAEYKKWNKK